MDAHFDVAIVGAGHGGAQAAIQLRQLGFAGTIGLIGAEEEPPYERPPLSKDYLAGEKRFERMLIRPESFWAEREVALVPGTRILSIDSEARTLAAGDGRSFGYGALVWATGGKPRRLTCEGGDLAGVHVLRCRAEVDRIRAELERAERVAVIGGGYIGLEAAAVFTKLGKQVTVVEALERVLARVAAPEISHFYEAEHCGHGVALLLGRSVDRILGKGGRARSVVLGDGTEIETDLVIAGIGIQPEADPLLEAGAEGGNGVHVDSHCRTSLPDVYAIGDCAAQVSRFAGGARVRLESVQNAHDQASTAARAIAGQPAPNEAVPWFWSNQYDLRLQTIGLSLGHDRTILRGRPEDRSFSLVYLREGRVIALDCVNATRDYAQGRRLVLEGASPDPARLADSSVPLKELG
ncbi:MAG TPA: FAD-dependent oxidoreductase [Allosphingosinicella sp.]